MQVLECRLAPPSCHGHECWIDSSIPMSIAIQAPCKKVLLLEADSPVWLDSLLLVRWWELASLQLLLFAA